MPILQPNDAPQQDGFIHLLERAGFKVRGNRADCPHCDGHARLTVRIGPGEVYFCHRCKRSGNARTLSRQLKIDLLPESREVLERRALDNKFTNWRDKRQRVLAKTFHTLSRRAEWAKAALAYYPEWELAWDTLGAFYHREAELSVALDALSCEKVSIWLDEPTTHAELFAAFQEVSRAS